MSKDNEVKELRDEIEELKAVIKNLAKSQEEAYKNVNIPEEEISLPQKPMLPRKPPRPSKPERPDSVRRKKEAIERAAKRRLERDIANSKEKADHIHKVVRIDPRKMEFDFDTEEFTEAMKEIKERATQISKQGLKAVSKISEKISKNIQNVMDKESERIRTTVEMTKEELEEITEELEDARKEIEEAQLEMENARKEVIVSRNEVRNAQLRMERARQYGDVKEQKDAQKYLEESLRELREAEEDIRDFKSDLAQEKREFARLQKRANKMYYAHKEKRSPRVLGIGDVDVDGTFTEYIDKVMNSVGKSLESSFRTVIGGGKKALKSTSKLDKDGKRITVTRNHKEPTGFQVSGHVNSESFDDFSEETADLLSALGDKNRIKILKILENSPQYQKELSEETELRGGTFKHHTDILQDANYITREAIRGRYLITQLGIEALKLGEMIFLRKKRIEEEEESIDIDIED